VSDNKEPHSRLTTWDRIGHCYKLPLSIIGIAARVNPMYRPSAQQQQTTVLPEPTDRPMTAATNWNGNSVDRSREYHCTLLGNSWYDLASVSVPCFTL